MVNKKIFWAVVVILAAGIMVSCSIAMRSAGELQSMGEKYQRSVDYMEIQNVFSRHSYYYAAQQQWVELDTIWSKTRDDISYGHNNGYYYGRESVENYYGKANEERRKSYLETLSKLYPEVENKEEYEGVGDLVMHTLTTPNIQIADDGQTAQGIWMSIGLCSSAGKDGKPSYAWMWEKFGVDFIKEGSQWKIWHFQIYTETMFTIPETMWNMMPAMPAGKTGENAAPSGEGAPAMPGDAMGEGEDAAGGMGAMPGGDKSAGPMSGKPVMDKLVEMYTTYSATTVPQLVPEIPEPYGTWEDTTPQIK